MSRDYKSRLTNFTNMGWSYRSQDESDALYTSKPLSGEQLVAPDNLYSDLWTWTVKTTDANTAGQVGMNAATWSAATAININVQTASNRDMRIALSRLFKLNNQILLQHKTDSSRYGVYKITGTPVDNGTWWQFPVTFQASDGVELGGNTGTVVTILVTP